MDRREFFIKPAEGVNVRDPLTGLHLAAEGESKPMSSYWLRRRNDGDVAETKPPKVQKGE